MRKAPSTASSISSILHDVMVEDCAMSYSGESDEDNDDDSSSDQTFRTMKSDYSKLNEIKAIQNMARAETIKLQTWRCIVMVAMLLTGAMLSVGANRYLVAQEQKKAMESVRVDGLACMGVFIPPTITYKLTLFLSILPFVDSTSYLPTL
jgi:hypothetical protein